MTFSECITLLETLIAWPLVVFILTLFFLIIFRDAIGHLIKNLRIQTPDGLSLSVQAQEALNADYAGNFISLEDQQKIAEHIQELEMQAEQKLELERVFQQLYQDKQRFEFLWINQLISSNQKFGLLFIQRETPFIGYFNEAMLKRGVPNIEWLITFLRNFDLIAIRQDMMISITPKGQQFIDFLNQMKDINGIEALKSLFEHGYDAGFNDAKNK